MSRQIYVSNGQNLLPIISSYLQLSNEFSEYFQLKVKGVSFMFECLLPSKIELIPNFSVQPITCFAELNQEELICIVPTVNETICVNYLFNTRNVSSEIISDSLTTVFTDKVNSLLSTGVYAESEKYDVVKPLQKTGKDGGELSSYRPLYNT